MDSLCHLIILSLGTYLRRFPCTLSQVENSSSVDDSESGGLDNDVVLFKDGVASNLPVNK